MILSHLRKTALALLIAAAFSATPAVSHADSRTFNAIFFRPATGLNTYLMLYDTRTLKQLQFDSGMYFSYAYDPLDVRFGTAPKQKVIDHMLTANFVAALGALDFLQFGIDMPIVLINRFEDPYAPGTPRQNRVDIGDIRFESKVRVLDPCKTRVGLGFVPFITFPTGNSSHFVGNPGVTGGLMAVLDGRIHPRFGMTLNVGYQGGKKTAASNVELQHKFMLGLGAEGNLNYGVDLFAEINAEGDLSNLFSDVDRNPTEAVAGARWDIKQTGVTLHTGFGTCLVCGVRGARFRGVLGAKYRLMTDKNKAKELRPGPHCMAAYAGFTRAQLLSLAKNCPPDPEEWKQGVHDDACPKYYELKELAGLLLRCPPTAEGFDPRFHDQACPKVFDLADLYSPDEIRNIVALGLAEMSLVCPENPENFNAQIHDQACPKYYDLELTRTLAKICPAPEAFRSGIDDPSCPKYYTLRDTYGEIDWNEVDALAGVERGRYSGIRGGEIHTVSPVYFDFNSARIKPEAEAGMLEVVRTINATPWITVVRVGGHADAIGSAAANEKISMDRCRAVIAYMRSHGLRPGIELVPVAYGSFRPAADNETERGRQLNRRVVFTITNVRHRGEVALTSEEPLPVRHEPAREPALYSPPSAPAPVEPVHRPVYQPTEPEPVQPAPHSPVITAPAVIPEGQRDELAPIEPPKRWQQR